MHAMAWIRETSNQNEHRVRRATFSKSAAVIWKNITNKIPSVKATYILYLKDHFYVWEGPFYHLLLYEPTWRYLSNVASSCILNAVIKTVLLNWSGGVNPRLSLKVVWTETHITFRQLPCHFPITSCDLPMCDENNGFLPIGLVLSAHDILIWNSIWLEFFNILQTNLWCKVVVIKRCMDVLMSYNWQRSTVLERVSHKSNRRTQSTSCNGSTDGVVCTEKRVKHFLVFWNKFSRSYSNLIRSYRCWWRIWRRNVLVTTLACWWPIWYIKILPTEWKYSPLYSFCHQHLQSVTFIKSPSYITVDI